MPESSSMRVGFGLGSNLGDRGQALEEAMVFLGNQGSDLICSALYESEPVDCPPDSPWFLNAAAEINFAGDLLQLLERCQNFERTQGRPEIRPKNSPRPVDLDLLYAGEVLLNEPRLILPHPRLATRAFVLLPLLEICPNRIIPGLNKNVRELWQELKGREEHPLCRKVA